MTHLLKSSRTTVETSLFSARAFCCAADQRSSLMRMLRRVVPLGIDGGDESRVEAADGEVFVPADDVGACDVLDDGAEVSGLDVFDALSGVEGSGEGGDDWCAHIQECTYMCRYTQEVGGFCLCWPNHPDGKGGD